METVTVCSATLGEDEKREPPLGPLYIAGAFRAAGVEVDFRDFQLCEGANAWSPNVLAQFLQAHGDVLALSCFVDMLPCVIAATEEICLQRPNTTVILGGPGPSKYAAELLELFPWIDAVAIGEGEDTVRQWVRTQSQSHTVDRPIPGLVYRGASGIVNGGLRPRIDDLSLLPKPAYELVDWEQYTQARIITTRGCAYKCSFCDVTAFWGNKSVYLDIEAAVDEMEHLRDAYGMTQVGVVDDTFVQNRKRVVQFCNLLLERDARIEWGCFGRVNLMTPELVDLMAAAGCRAVFYGIDSGSQPILDRVQKVLQQRQIKEVVEYSARVIDKVEASFIWGYPFEKLDDFRQTLELAAEISMFAPKVNVQLHMLSPLPNSPIYTEFKGRLREPEPEDRPWLLLPALLLEPRAKQLRLMVQNTPHLFPGFYTFPTHAKRTKRRLLEKAMSALDRTVGSTLLDQTTARLMVAADPSIEQKLLLEAKTPSDRIGVGLALGFLRRSRRRRGLEKRDAFDGTRGPRILRQHNDLQVGAS